MRPSWDEYFLEIAKAVSTRADCTRRKVGVVIVDARHRIIATGYNGSEPGGPSCLAGQCPRGQLNYEQQPGLVGSYDNCISTHAEANALMFARTDCHGATMYSTMYSTDLPCVNCSKLVTSAGIIRVVVRKEDK